MRDLIVFLLSMPLLWMSLRNGLVAYLLWCWAGLISIQSYLYGFMASIPYVQVFAIIALVNLVIKKDLENKYFKLNGALILFIIFGGQIVLSATFAYEGHTRNWELASNMIKTLLFCALMPIIITTRLRIHVLVTVIAVAIGYHGIVDGFKFIASGGGHQARGIVKFGDNNHYAMVLLMVLPLLGYLYKYSKNLFLAKGYLIAIPLVVLGVVATQSRGAIVCLGVIVFGFVLRSRQKFVGLVGIALCAVLVLQLAPERWFARMNTIENASDDASLLGRVGAWQVSTAIALQNPIFGGGPHVVELSSVWEKYRGATGLLSFLPMDLNGLPGRGRAAHSIYFETMGDLGFFGFIVFVSILIYSFKLVGDISDISKLKGKSFRWAEVLSKSLFFSMLAYCISGALLSAAYFELPYILVMLLQVLKLNVQKSDF